MLNGGLTVGHAEFVPNKPETMLDFYRQHQISPVKQDTSDLQAHFARRAFLYRSLGLPPIAIQGKSVLEIGPGSGDNALYTLSLQPSRYVLVEPNEKGRQEIENTLAGAAVEIHDETLEAFAKTGETFDVVICEGLLGLAGGNARGLLTAAGNTVKTGGALVITCIDPISQCADVLRRAMAQQYIKKGASLQENVEILKPIFTPHLATLKGMTRSVEDWIVDNILNPASIGPTFSIPDACEALEGRFAVLGCSPRFLLDWRWYKESDSSNSWAIESYWRNCHNLFDYRKLEPEKRVSENRVLWEICAETRRRVQALELAGAATGDPQLFDIAWFGRGQQYLSFVKVG
jgi:SAM-dependent methyltransferase